LPRSIHSPDALGAIQNALHSDPANVVALELQIAIDSESKDLERLTSAASRYRSVFAVHKPLTDLVAVFERSAHNIFGQFHRFRGIDGIRAIAALMADLAAVFTDSTTIRALHAIWLFELGDLRGAGDALSKLKHSQSTPPDLADLCEDAINQISDATVINTGEPSDSRLLIFDSLFPSQISSFRYGEFSAYLGHIDCKFSGETDFKF
jgi:hypothetical protein